MTRILATSDWQIGSHESLGAQPGDRLRDQEAVATRIVDLAIERNVDLFLHAGDVFHGPVVQPEHLGVFRRSLARLREAGIPVVVTSGNNSHDQAQRAENALAIFADFEGVTVSSQPGVYLVGGCAVSTLPWVHHGRYTARKNGGDRDENNAEIAAMLLDIAERQKDECEHVAPGLPHVLLGHWHVDNASSANGTSTSIFKEALLSLVDLERLGYDAIVLGHNHRAQVLSERPAIFHAGSPMPIDIGEAGFEHGAWVLDIPYAHAAFTPEFVPIESRPFVTIDVDFTDGDDFSQIIEGHGYWDPEARNYDGAIVRLRFTGTSSQMRTANVSAAVDALTAAGAHVVKLDPHTVHESRARVTVERPDEITEAEWLDRWMDVTETPEDARADVRAVFAGYVEGATA